MYKMNLKHVLYLKARILCYTRIITMGLRIQFEVLPLVNNGMIWALLLCLLCSFLPCMYSPPASPLHWFPSYPTAPLLGDDPHILKKWPLPFLFQCYWPLTVTQFYIEMLPTYQEKKILSPLSLDPVQNLEIQLNNSEFS